jgi:single-stranded-DNA-specific exonuclease
MLVKHLADDRLIYMIVDADCDGFTSSAILLNYLHEWMPSIVESKFYYVFHPGKQHGIDVS